MTLIEHPSAIIVACLASFRILYTRSERFRRSAFLDKPSNRVEEHLGNGPSIPLNARVVNSTPIAATSDMHHKRQISTDTFDEAILPMDDVYIQHEHSVLSGPSKRYDETQSQLKTPTFRPYSHRFSSYIRNYDTG
ncbi:hypothetical protein IMSHALPRED_009356 [Imshaugia aleurites]|uniref:Uncharacterized protein n=1 Tax=Imshaugia aleurites TaxID=172621 RepID=A0A8H3FW99_9LECA|nr:hypothetical protein IMSHALPRED_009356 [Imshaugia aleurites]